MREEYSHLTLATGVSTVAFASVHPPLPEAIPRDLPTQAVPLLAEEGSVCMTAPIRASVAPTKADEGAPMD